jgi:hypothetical protein
VVAFAELRCSDRKLRKGGPPAQELKTGEVTGGKFHSTKAEENISRINNLLKSNKSLTAYDQTLAKAIIQDLRNALERK